MKKLATKKEVIKSITSNITNMVSKLNCYGGSSEVEWAYSDFRSDMIDILEARKKSVIRFTEEDATKIGMEIIKALNKEVKKYSEE